MFIAHKATRASKAGRRKLGVESWASKAGHRKLGIESWATKAGRRKLDVESWATGRVAFSLLRWEYTANSVVPETSFSIRVCVSSFDIIERKRNIFILNSIRSKAPSPSHFCGERSRLCCTTYYFFNMQE